MFKKTTFVVNISYGITNIIKVYYCFCVNERFSIRNNRDDL